jgi:hypothetical protein
MTDRLSATITAPFEMEYGNQSGVLTLRHVDTLGRQVEIRFDPYATRILCEAMNTATKLRGEALGLPSDEQPNKH